MFWLILSILSVSGLFIMFKIIDKTNTPLINALVINYLVATIIGFIYTKSFNLSEIIFSDWFFAGVFIGILFIVTFFILGLSTNKIGISISTVASKMSVIVTILFSVFAFHENISVLKIISIIFSIIAVFFCIYKPNKEKQKTKKIFIFLPIILFLGMGTVDSLVVFSKETFPELQDNFIAAKFTSTAFGVSFITGLFYTFIKPKLLKNYLKKETLIFGTILGLINFGSIYFVIRTLNANITDNSIIYGIVNISCVAISVLIGKIFFKERLTALNYIGISLSVITLILLNFS
ncbi:MAG: hypothetical protein LBV69_01350 [Bacteroidales bacterium]|jgi:drug/metabolite transporter (DMT)-like permease|nr:hypothetical protein [Bacteroidales bacterium]